MISHMFNAMRDDPGLMNHETFLVAFEQALQNFMKLYNRLRIPGRTRNSNWYGTLGMFDGIWYTGWDIRRKRVVHSDISWDELIREALWIEEVILHDTEFNFKKVEQAKYQWINSNGA